MRVLIYCPSHEGHHFVFIKLLIPEICRVGASVVLAITAKGRNSKEFRTHLEPISGAFDIDTNIDEPKESSEFRRKSVSEFRAAVERQRPEYVLAPAADSLLPLLGINAVLGRWRVPSGIRVEFALIRANFGYLAKNVADRARFWAKEVVISLPISQDPLLVIDPVAFENINARGSALAGKTRLVPEPLDDVQPVERAAARRRLGLPEAGRYIGCTGLLDTRKGIDRLIKAFTKADLAGNDRLLLAGVLDKDVESAAGAELKSLAANGRVVLLNRYLTDEELNLAICATDVVSATYWTAHCAPSGIVNRAAVIGRPVLASRFGWSDFMVPEFGLGTLTDISNPETFARDIATALEQSGSFVQSPKTARLREFLSPGNFAACWTANIAKRLGGRIPKLRTWEWVRGRAAG